jgi:cell wall-associated NlpC family hydrolase
MTVPAPASIPQRARFVAKCVERMHSPYLWGAKGKAAKPGFLAFDCSGLVTWCWLQVGGDDWRQTHNAARLWDDLRATANPRAGTLVFYGPRNAPNHVMVALGEGVALGASGGGRDTLTLGEAEAQGARVKVFAHYIYRPDVLGFRELPFAD